MSNSIEKLAKEAERLAENLQGNPFLAFDRIAKDIRERQDNAIAMEFTKCIGKLLKKNGVVPKMTESTRNFETDKTFETRYGVSIDELDFSEHDKVFEDKITELEQRIRELIKEKDEYKRKCNDFGFENQDLKEIIKDYEDKIAELEKAVVNYKQAFEDKCKDYKTTSEVLGKYQQENESLKQRIAELESKETSELPFDALETANYLINSTYERETSSLERIIAKTPDKVNSDRYTIDDLEQISEHLLVYCKHNKECEE